jgi:hypothetical protein
MIVIVDESSRFANRCCRASGKAASITSTPDDLKSAYRIRDSRAQRQSRKKPPDHTFGGLLLMSVRRSCARWSKAQLIKLSSCRHTLGFLDGDGSVQSQFHFSETATVRKWPV